MTYTVLVTGASRGIGLSLSNVFASKGYNLIMLSKTISQSSEQVTSLRRLYPDSEINAISLDLSDLHSLNSYSFSSLPVDILVNSAGIFPIGSVDSISLDQCIEAININQIAPLFLSQAFLPYMKSKQFGRIINIGSSSSYNGFPNTALYCSTKHGLLGLSRSMDSELASYGIRCICISPASVNTDMGKTVIGQDINTFIDPDELANICLNLIEPHNSLVIPEISIKRTSYE